MYGLVGVVRQDSRVERGGAPPRVRILGVRALLRGSRVRKRDTSTTYTGVWVCTKESDLYYAKNND